jgi:NAD dependent epimerase/dehydratase family enzyme
VPPLLLRLLFGREAANETILTSARLVPARLLAAGFRFRYPDLEGALCHVLRRNS